MPHAGPDSAIIQQWERKVARWVGQGLTREQILYEMSAANWLFDDAEKLLRRTVGRQKRKWIFTMIICGGLAALGVTITYVSITNPNGGAVYVPIGATIGFIFALVRLVKIRA
jgi:predicted histidine transporter YuiF (NhaC family)